MKIGHLLFRENKKIKWSREDRDYYYVVVDHNGAKMHLLFTDKEMERAVARAKRNPEDLEKSE